ncbi:MAG TPA: GFA family protein [Gammaproteobacteria bacterium]|nr:GFA family protein [Gammaproteobacteria bacterium]
MITASCHCGKVSLELPIAPEQVTSCNCSICRRYGTLCAYYNPAEVRVSGETDIYMWGDKQIAFHRCRECGCATHWTAVDPAIPQDRMGVNARMLPPELLAQARVRRFDGADTWKFLD